MLGLAAKDNRNMFNLSHQKEIRASEEAVPLTLIARKAMELLKKLNQE